MNLLVGLGVGSVVAFGSCVGGMGRGACIYVLDHAVFKIASTLAC